MVNERRLTGDGARKRTRGARKARETLAYSGNSIFRQVVIVCATVVDRFLHRTIHRARRIGNGPSRARGACGKRVQRFEIGFGVGIALRQRDDGRVNGIALVLGKMGVVGHGLQIGNDFLVAVDDILGNARRIFHVALRRLDSRCGIAHHGIRLRRSDRNKGKAAADRGRHAAREAHELSIQRARKSRSLRERQRHIANFAAGVGKRGLRAIRLGNGVARRGRKAAYALTRIG